MTAPQSFNPDAGRSAVVDRERIERSFVILGVFSYALVRRLRSSQRTRNNVVMGAWYTRALSRDDMTYDSARLAMTRRGPDE